MREVFEYWIQESNERQLYGQSIEGSLKPRTCTPVSAAEYTVRNRHVHASDRREACPIGERDLL